MSREYLGPWGHLWVGPASLPCSHCHDICLGPGGGCITVDWLRAPRPAPPGCLGSSCGKRGSFRAMDKLLSSSHLLGCRQPRMSSRTQASRTKGPSVDRHCKQARQTDQQTDRQHRQAGGAPKTPGPSPVPSSLRPAHAFSCTAARAQQTRPSARGWPAARRGLVPLRGSLQCCLAVCSPCCAHAHCHSVSSLLACRHASRMQVAQ